MTCGYISLQWTMGPSRPTDRCNSTRGEGRELCVCVAYYRKTCRIMSEGKQILFYSAKSLLPLVESIQSLCKPMWRWEKLRERIYILAGGGVSLGENIHYLVARSWGWGGSEWDIFPDSLTLCFLALTFEVSQEKITRYGLNEIKWNEKFSQGRKGSFYWPMPELTHSVKFSFRERPAVNEYWISVI